MKNFKHAKFLTAALILAGFATKVNAQAANANANATARIVPAISIVNNRHLVFGNITTGAGGGTVKIDADSAGARSKTGASLVLAPGTTSSAKFTVTGDGSATYAITRVPASGTNLVLTNTAVTGNPTMDAALTVSTAAGAGGETTTGQLSGISGANGTQAIFVGGILTVSATQAAGTYTNTGGIIITVDYN